MNTNGWTENSGTEQPGPRRAARTACALPVLLSALLLGLLLALAAPEALRAEPNGYEKQRIEAEALEAFHRVLALWREEVYFELYALGSKDSQGRLDQEEFAQRMVELEWVPDGVPNPKYVKTEFQYRTLVYIKVRIPYRHKFNPQRRFSREHTLLMQKEGEAWRVDLVQLIRTPFS
ncbi:MAG: hypothetical protein OEZ59_12300 [Deltaproteobacteria bacterium]|nr:hypothetical protein [Deltaproteobacteria bacterium]